jgi:hypothetical protein
MLHGYATAQWYFQMFLGMSKELKRVRPAKKPEEGEVMDSEDDEEGRLILE